MSTHDTEIVSALRLAIAQHVGTDRFDLWFAETELEFDNETLRVSSANRFTLEWVRKNLRPSIERACQDVLGRMPSLTFSETTRKQGPSATDGDARGNNNSGTIAADASRPTPGQAVSRSGVQRRRFRNLESFVVGTSNRLAFTAAEMVVRTPGECSPLCIHGPTGVGKTHLLEGIWSAIRRGPERRRCVYLTAEQFTSYFLESLNGRGLPSFRRRYRELDLLIVEDVQFLIGKSATLTEFQYTVDALLREGRQLVFSADRNPAALARLGPEITTRLAGGLVAYLPPPDLALRLDILRSLVEQRGMAVGDEVLQRIAEHLTEDVRVLSGALNRLQAASCAAQAPITLELAEKSLEELFLASRCSVRLDDIQRVVCDVFGVDARALRSNSRARQLSHPRMLAMWLARKHTRSVLSEIGEYFGNRSHSTVISAEKRVNGWVCDGLVVRLPDCDCRVEEAIRRIEAKLRAS